MKIQSNDILQELERALYIYFRLTTRENLQVNKTLSMTHSELEILDIIGKTKNCSITDVANKAEMTLAGASLFVSKLEKKGVVKKVKNPQKLSQLVVTVTSPGKKACKVHEAYHRRHNEVLMNFLNSLEQDELETSHRLAATITEWMQSFYDEATE